MPSPPTDDRTRPAPTGYRTLYGAAGVFGFPLSFATLYEPTHDGTMTRTFGSLWTLALGSYGNIAMVGVLLMLALISCCLAGAFHTPRSPALPVTTTVLSILALVMILAEPGVSGPRAPIADGGAMLAALSGVIATIGVVHAVQVGIGRQRPPSENEQR
ncbi:hypothetical protein [Microlunatus soli]|uniref:SPW repeat-containing protein n=1 Tax=Microlunatus soli TaxID=630515 RepID=A0A1H1NQD8_9ACTN|nr:hypothetical protein [Microlunatus soli]SDS01172.1 hypothetical protein SAMN04489812_0604 [Microlunatus soli]